MEVDSEEDDLIVDRSSGPPPGNISISLSIRLKPI